MKILILITALFLWKISRRKKSDIPRVEPVRNFDPTEMRVEMETEVVDNLRITRVYVVTKRFLLKDKKYLSRKHVNNLNTRERVETEYDKYGNIISKHYYLDDVRRKVVHRGPSLDLYYVFDEKGETIRSSMVEVTGDKNAPYKRSSDFFTIDETFSVYIRHPYFLGGPTDWKPNTKKKSVETLTIKL